MQVILANPAGACYGVDRALSMAFDAIEPSSPARAAHDDACGLPQEAGCAGSAHRVSTLGPLIHNPQVVAILEARGVKAVEGIDDIEDPAGSTLIIRSHGVPAGTIDRARARGLHVIDATCPHVSRAQAEAARLAADGRLVVILGEPGHPEVEAILSYAGPHSVVLEDVAGVQDLPPAAKVGLVVQTTQPLQKFNQVCQALASRYADFESCNTICASTEHRQKAAVELARRVDAMVVIGGRISGNTRRLAQLCAAQCAKTHHVESAGELRPQWFSDCASVGVTAGASTPQSQIEQVLHELERF